MPSPLRLLSTLALCTTIVATTARADELSEGLQLFEAMEYQSALPHFTTARDNESLSAAERASAALHIGVIHLTLGDEELARASLREALLLDRALAVPTSFSPKVKEMVDALRAQLPAPGSTPSASAPASEPPAVLQPADGAAVDAAAAPAAAVDEEDSMFSEWWFWTGAAAVAAAAAVSAGVAIYLIFFQGQPDPVDPEETCDAPSGEGCLRVKF